MTLNSARPAAVEDTTASFATDIWLVVSVPVLSEQITVVQPSVSTYTDRPAILIPLTTSASVVLSALLGVQELLAQPIDGPTNPIINSYLTARTPKNIQEHPQTPTEVACKLHGTQAACVFPGTLW